MAFQFPPSPAVDQTFTPVAGVTYRWSGTAWHLLAGPGSFISAADGDTRYVNVDEVSNTTNRIINGKMAIDQRNAGGAVIANATTTNPFCPDRWYGFTPGPGAFSLIQILDQPRVGEIMLKAQVTTADAAPASDRFYMVGQRIEGYQVADLNFGASSAKSFTFAFEVFSSINATLPIVFRNVDNTRSYVTTFSVVASAFATISVTVPGDVTGTWNKTNGTGLRVEIVLAAGSGYLSTPNTWLPTGNLTVAGCTNFMATLSNVLYLGNVRLYKGSVDFGPDRRLYAEELALCQRYFCKSYDQDAVPGAVTNNGVLATIVRTASASTNFVPVEFPVTMRAVPTVTLYSSVTGATGAWRTDSGDVAASSTLVNSKRGTAQNTATATVGNGFFGHFTASAEL